MEYLQTRGLDYLSAWNMVLTAKQELQAVKFEDVNRTAVTFVSEVNRCLLQKELDTEVESKLREGVFPYKATAWQAGC